MPSAATKTRKSESAKAKTSRPSRQSAAVRNILNAGVQPKLKIGAVNDPAEIEADRVADQVMRMPTPSASEAAPAAPPPASGSGGNGAGPPPVRRKCAACDDDKIQRKPSGAKITSPKTNTPSISVANFTPPTIRMKAPGGTSGGEVGGTPASTSAETAINSLGSGSPLASSERTFFEPRFGRDLSSIRIHTNGTADTASRAINARAFSLGNNIAFANGEYQPGTHPGRTLMAHEITHSLQGGSGVNRVVRRKCDITEALDFYGQNSTHQWTVGLVERLYEVAGPSAAEYYERSLAAGQIDESFVRLVCSAQTAMGLTGSGVDGEIGGGTTGRFTQWQGWATETADITLCFVPISWQNIGQYGAVHAVLNIPNNASVLSAEVDPNQHSGSENPGGIANGTIAGMTGLHSHVSTHTGARQSGDCQTISTHKQEALRAIAAVRQYENLDVVYAPPRIGPNSNSFAEWVLHNAGISTASITVPSGALGWSYYIDNPSERLHPPRVARRLSQTQSTCGGRHSTPRTFTALVDLIRQAEQEMKTNGVANVFDRLSIIRGIFYGSPWSIDYETSQQSHIRNGAFNVYVDPASPAQPRNPLEVMDCNTYLSLASAAEVQDSATNRQLDVGHLIIGMDARQSDLARSVDNPVGGATGLEAVTWAGDLGGAAARTAITRVSSPSANVLRYFRGSDYGGSVNIEGDVAAYAVAQTPGWRAIDAPGITLSNSGEGIADALDNYFFARGTIAAGWDTRCKSFLTGIGATINSANVLTNRATVLDYLSVQIADFACWYMRSYQSGGTGLTEATMRAASRHIVGAANEVAQVYLSALERCLVSPGTPIEARPPAPATSPLGEITCTTARFSNDPSGVFNNWWNSED